jgi:hypothetical protein
VVPPKAQNPTPKAPVERVDERVDESEEREREKEMRREREGRG